MKTSNLLVLCLLAILASAFPLRAEATAAFARQTAMPCASCHFQNFPALTPFGRLFKAGGYRLLDAPIDIDRSALGLPFDINGSVITKLRYQRSNGPKIPGQRSTNDGDVQFPDEFLVTFAGHVTRNVGFIVELDPHDTDPLVSGLKVPMMWNAGGFKLGAIGFNTATQGVAYGFELLNTGAVRFARIAEDRNAISAQQYIGTATKAQGLALVASNQLFFANFSKWSPRAMREDASSPTANYLRLGVTPILGGWDFGFGLQAWDGTATEPAANVTVATEAWALDAQAQGSVRGRPLGLYLSYANAKGSAAGAAVRNLFNGNPGDRKATAASAQWGVVPGKATLVLGYRKGDNGRALNGSDRALLLGGTWLVRPNQQLQLNYTMYSGAAYDGRPANGDRMLTLMFYTSL